MDPTSGGHRCLRKSLRAVAVSLLIAAPFIFAPPVARAGSDPVQNLGEMVVTQDPDGLAQGMGIDPTATTIQVDTHGAPHTPYAVQDILESLAGIDIQRGDKTLSDSKDVVKIRGLGARRIMVRIDGRPVRNAGGFWDKMVDWNALTLDNVDRVEVIRGSHSAVYGETIGGTVNIVTQKGGNRLDGRPQGRVMADYSGYNTRKAMAGLSGSFGAMDYALGGAFRQSDGFLKNSDYILRDFNTRLSYTFPFDGCLTLGYKESDQDKNPYTVNDPDDPLAADFYDPSYPVVPAVNRGASVNYPGSDSFEKRETRYWDLFYEQPSAVGDIKVHLYKSREFRDESHYNYSPRAGFYDYTCDVTFEDWGWMAHDRFALGSAHQITVGAEGREYKMGYNAAMPSMTWQVPKDDMLSFRAGFVEDVWQITDKLTLALGLRYDRVEMDVDVGYPGYDDFQKTMDAWCPKSRLTYAFTPRTRGYLNMSRAFRMPTAMEFNWMGAPTGQYIDPETAMQYEGGIIHSLPGQGTLKLGVYHYDIHNYIVLNRDPNSLLRAGRIQDTVFNADSLVLQGLEMELRFKILDRLKGYVTYTFQESKLSGARVPESDLYDDHYQLPRHKASLGLDWALSDTLDLMAALRCVDSRKTSLDQEIAGFATMDLALAYQLPVPGLRLKGYVTNLFDADYEEQYKVPAQDRILGINLSYRF